MRGRLLASTLLFLATLAAPGLAGAANARVGVLSFRPLSDPGWAANWRSRLVYESHGEVLGCPKAKSRHRGPHADMRNRLIALPQLC